MPDELHPSRSPPLRRSWWRTWRLWFVLLALVAGFVCWWYWDQQQGEAELAAVIAQWDREGPWRWKDWLASRPHPSDEDNGALIIDQMARLKQRNPETELSIFLLADQEYHPQHLLHADQLSEYRARLVRWKDVLALFPVYVSKPLAVWTIPANSSPWTVLLPSIQHTRDLHNLLSDQFQVYLHDGKLKEACQQLELGLLLTRNMDHPSSLIGRLVNIAIVSQYCSWTQRLLALSEPGEALLAKLQAELHRFDEQQSWKKTILIETGWMDQSIREIRQGTVDINKLWGGGISGSWWQDQVEKVQFFFMKPRLLSARHHAECLQYLLDGYHQSLQPWSVQLKSWKKVSENIKKERGAGNYRLAHLMIPAMEKVIVAQMQMIAGVRTAQVGLAAERFRLVEKRWPVSQQELVGRFLDAVQLDPFDDQPLRFKRTDDGLIIYSIGRNEVDNEGVVLPIMEPYQQNLDVGIRLWDVSSRHQPALPLPKQYLEKLEELKSEQNVPK